MATAAQVTALILAGGQSRRMGTDKALLNWQGVPLLRRVYEVAAQCCSTVAVLTPWPERYHVLLPTTVHWLIESPSGQGPLLALAQGLSYLTTDWLLLLACDLPQLNLQVLQHWILQLPATDPQNIAYVPYQNSHWEPLCGLYHRSGKAALQTFIANDGRAFQPWLSEIAAVPLKVDKEISPMLWNCNRPTDFNTPPSCSHELG
jgi:molybdenum cofactor guanylyltransferase